MSNNFDQFEQLMRDSVDGFEVPYDAGSWGQMDNSLNQVAKAKTARNITTIAASITGVGLVVGGLFYFSGNSQAPHYVISESIEYKSDSGEQPFTTQSPVATAIAPAGNDVEPLAVQIPVNKDINTSTVIQPPVDGNTVNNSTPTNNVVAPDQTVDHTPIPAGNAPTAEDANVVTANFNIVQSTVEGCEGLMVEFSIDNAEVAGDFLWNFGDGQTSADRSVLHTYKSAGEFEVVLTVSNGKDFAVKMATDPIRVFGKPAVKFGYGVSEQNVEPKTIFTNHSDQAISYLWKFGDGTESSEKDPQHRYEQKGTYSVTLEATNVYNCTTVETAPVQIDRKYNLFAPTGFTPNGDNVNDSWMPGALPNLDVNFTMTIYDSQSGDMVYENREVDRPWDGRDMSGRITNGIYVWVVVIKDQFGQEDIYKGFVTLRK
jgi:gliding motility-associated-like protein